MMAGYIVMASFATFALLAGYYQIGWTAYARWSPRTEGTTTGSRIWSLGVTRADSGEDIGYVMHSAEVAVGDELEVFVDPRGWVHPVSGFWLPEALQYSAGIAIATLLGLVRDVGPASAGVVPPIQPASAPTSRRLRRPQLVGARRNRSPDFVGRGTPMRSRPTTHASTSRRRPCAITDGQAEDRQP